MRGILRRVVLALLAALLLLLAGCAGSSGDAGPTDGTLIGSATGTTTPTTAPVSGQAGVGGATGSGTSSGASTPAVKGTAHPSPATTPVGAGSSRTATFVGLYVKAANVRSFVPCGRPDRPGDGVGWWLTADPGSGLDSRYAAALRGSATDPTTPARVQANHIVYLRFTGTLSEGNPAGYGYHGSYRGQLVVHRVLDVQHRPTCPGMQGAPPS
jgi:hypothetical protein